MNSVFEMSSIGNIKLKNRILRSATHEGLGDENGHPKKELSAIYENLAKNNIGAIITGVVGIQSNGKTMKNMRMFNTDEYINDYKSLNSDLKKHETPLILQVAHGGGTCSPKITGEVAVAPTAIKLKGYPTKPKELSEKEIEHVIIKFVDSIERAKKADFAGVQLHAAHGYLLSQFLSPHCNKRKDSWGGTTKNRFKIIKMIIKEARRKVDNYPILIKISAHDGNKDGIKIQDSINIAELLEDTGCDAIEVSCGSDDGFNCVRVSKIPITAAFKLVPWYKSMSPLKKKFVSAMAPFIFTKYRPLHNYNVEAASQIKRRIKIPVIVVGGIRKLEDITHIFDKNAADYVSMSRPFIIEPNIITKFIDKQQYESRCINCGYCLLGVSAKPLKCYYGKLPKDV